MFKNNKDRTWVEFGNKLTGKFGENQKLFYNTLKSMRKPKPNTLKNVKDKNGNILTEENEIMERWREYFEELLEVEQVEGNKIEQNKNQHIPQEQQEQIGNITQKELTNAINKIKMGKAPGHDDITAEMLKYMNEERQLELLKIMNMMRKREKKVPLDWQMGIITPLYKKGDNKECSNYRGITLG
ncbi:uncharacterized protein LOC126887736 isoform X2 [Diabrotica virgifera virgifera]|uniref:Uncharacterized protein n=1 Tax=Diabrotica virgifera virgifera TaxID=50390 RepID=A0ABM5KMI1_DIAVI|nr:uncharacterized protein LOC126887736 isoform X2 [Diabrotica virgifera virgifera]